MVSKTTSVEPEQRRWLMKALREASGELFGQFYRLDEKSLRWRPGKGEWCMKEIAAHVRDAEVLYLAQIEAISQRHNPRLPHEPIECYPQERDYRSEPLQHFLSAVLQCGVGLDQLQGILISLDGARQIAHDLGAIQFRQPHAKHLIRRRLHGGRILLCARARNQHQCAPDSCHASIIANSAM